MRVGGGLRICIVASHGSSSVPFACLPSSAAVVLLLIVAAMKRSQTLMGGLVALLALWASLAAGIIPLPLSKGEQQVVQLVHYTSHHTQPSALSATATVTTGWLTDRSIDCLRCAVAVSCRCGRWCHSAPTRWRRSATTSSSSESVQKRSVSSSRSVATSHLALAATPRPPPLPVHSSTGNHCCGRVCCAVSRI